MSDGLRGVEELIIPGVSPEDPSIEGLLEWPESGRLRGGVVVAHPHPLHGSSMAQPVVYRTAQACRAVGLATLRLNFRGVGRSSGDYSGREEYRDVLAVASYMRSRLDALSAGDSGVAGGADIGSSRLPMALVGYSFGSIMSAVATRDMQPQALVLIGFAVATDLIPPAPLDRLEGFGGPVFAVCAEHDEVAPPEEVEETLRDLGLDYRMSVLMGTDHFFEGRQHEVGERVASFLDQCF